MTDQPRLTRRRAAPPPGIVHLGLGAFFRAHGAPVVEQAGGAWGITGVSLRSSGIRDRLVPQGCAYTAVALAPNGAQRHVVDVLNDVVFAPDAPDALIARMADPAIRVVSLTVTEKGYCHIPSTGALDTDHPDIQHDIAHATPISAIGYITRALAARWRVGLRPFTVLSCDNLPDNGRVARSVVLGLAQQIDSDLAQWIASEARFPTTMVDRIVPATTDENIAGLAQDTGVFDAAPVFHEPFLQWVIEDNFVDDARPAFDRVPGVQLVSDVAPFEAMKLRMLNGTHSSLAYLGYLAGYETISDTVADRAFRAFVKKLWSDEIIPTLQPPEGVDLTAYADALLSRYENASICHRTWQIAMDGSQKLPQRILGTLADNAANGRMSHGLCLAVAAWMRYVGGQDETGQPIDVRDPLAARLRALSQGAERPAEKVAALLSVQEIFGAGLDPMHHQLVTNSYEQLVQHGALASVANVVAGGT